MLCLVTVVLLLVPATATQVDISTSTSDSTSTMTSWETSTMSTSTEMTSPDPKTWNDTIWNIAIQLNYRYRIAYNTLNYEELVEQFYAPNATVKQEALEKTASGTPTDHKIREFHGHEQILAGLTKDGSQIMKTEIKDVKFAANDWKLLQPLTVLVTVKVNTRTGVKEYKATQYIRNGTFDQVHIHGAEFPPSK